MPETIEEFNKAFYERSLDFDSLRINKRRVGCMHFGGIVIECLIKFVIVKHYDIKERQGIKKWITQRNNSHVASNIVNNPYHNLIQGIMLVDSINQKIDSTIKGMIDIVQRPLGVEYIDLRYFTGDVSDSQYQEWEKAYLAINKWLREQLNII